MEEHPFLDELPLYALGALTPDELRTVELHLLEECQTCEPALIQLQNAAGSLPYSISLTEPPADLRKRLLARIEPRGGGPTPTGAIVLIGEIF